MADKDDGFINPNFDDPLSPNGFRSPPHSHAGSGSKQPAIDRMDVQPFGFNIEYVVTSSTTSSQKRAGSQQVPPWQYSDLSTNTAGSASSPVSSRPATAHAQGANAGFANFEAANVAGASRPAPVQGKPKATRPPPLSATAVTSGGDMSPASERWKMAPGEKRRYEQQFNELPTTSGYLPGDQARTFFLKSKLPNTDLSSIWRLSDIDNDGRLTLDEFCIAMHLTVGRRKGKPIPDATPSCLIPEKTEEKFTSASDVSATDKTWQVSKQPDIVAMEKAFQPVKASAQPEPSFPSLVPSHKQDHNKPAPSQVPPPHPIQKHLNLSLPPPPSRKASAPPAISSIPLSPASPVKSAQAMIQVTIPGISPKRRTHISAVEPDQSRDETDSSVKNRINQIETKTGRESGSEIPPPPIEKPKDLFDETKESPPSLPPKKKSTVKKAKNTKEKPGSKLKRRSSLHEKYFQLGDEESLLDPFELPEVTVPPGDRQKGTAASVESAGQVQGQLPHPLVASHTVPVIVPPPSSQRSQAVNHQGMPSQIPSNVQKGRDQSSGFPSVDGGAAATPLPSERSPKTKEKGHSRASSLDINIVFKTREMEVEIGQKEPTQDQATAGFMDFPPTLPPRDFPAVPPKRKPKKPAPDPPTGKPLKSHIVALRDSEGSPSMKKGHKKAVSLDTFSSKVTQDFTRDFVIQDLRAKTPDDIPVRRKDASVSPPPSLPDVTESPQPQVTRREKKKAPPAPIPYHKHRESVSPDDFTLSSPDDTYATVDKPKKNKSVTIKEVRKLKDKCFVMSRLNSELSNDLVKVKEERHKLQVQLEKRRSKPT